MERNYNLLETALEVIPLPILSCEEGLLSGILMANQILMKGVKKKPQIQKSRSASPSGVPEKEADGSLGESLDQAEFANLTSFGGGLGGGTRLKTLESHAARIDTVFSELQQLFQSSLDGKQVPIQPTHGLKAKSQSFCLPTRELYNSHTPLDRQGTNQPFQTLSMQNSKNAVPTYQTVNEKSSFLESTPGQHVNPAKRSP